MKFFSLVLFALFSMSFVSETVNFEKAKEEASKSGKYILLNFSGSDWCGPCIRMHKEIFTDAAFTSYADQSIIMVNADFPRLKKNQLSKELQQQNNALAERYNSKGIFPFTALLDADGKVLKTWEGLPNETAGEFANEIKAVLNASK